MTRRGLGRGLDALLASTEAGASEVRDLPLAAVRPNPFQPRRHMDPEALDELVASIRAHGLIQPLVVAPDGDGFVLIAGERRWRAARLAGLERVMAVVRPADAREMLALAIVENVQRADLDPIEAAEAYRRLMDEFSLTQADVAELVGKSRVAIANAVRLLGLAEEVRALVAGGQLTEGHARALLMVDDPAERLALARLAVAGGWTVRRVEAEARASRAPHDPPARPGASPSAPGSLDPDTAAAARDLEALLGTRVEIRRRGDGGQVVVHFYSQEELAALYDRLMGRG